jgi:hypothetical protein
MKAANDGNKHGGQLKRSFPLQLIVVIDMYFISSGSISLKSPLTRNTIGFAFEFGPLWFYM